MALMFLGMLFVVLATSCYLHMFIRRMLIGVFKVSFNKRKTILIRVFSIIISLPAIWMYGIYAIIYFHLIVISLVLEIAYRVLRRYRWFEIGFTTGIFSIIILAMILGYGYYNINQVSETEYTLESSKVSDLKILQITDLHMSNAINKEELTAYCNEMSKLDADIVVLTGDIVDERTPLEDMRAACRILSTISNKKGIYYVFGNHDPSTYALSPAFHEQDVKEEFEKNGITVLKDQVVTVDNITIVGRLDRGIERDRVSSEELLKDVDKNNYIIMLDHQPLDLDKNASLGVDLQLSGHTHGGQLFPLREVQQLFTDVLVYGKRVNGPFTAITSSGISAWGYPLRTEGKSEYVLITVQ